MLTINASGPAHEVLADLRAILPTVAARITSVEPEEQNELLATIKGQEFELKELRENLAKARERVGLLEGMEVELEDAMKEIKRLQELLGAPGDKPARASSKKKAKPDAAETEPQAPPAPPPPPATTPAGVAKDPAVAGKGKFNVGDLVTLTWANGSKQDGKIVRPMDNWGLYGFEGRAGDGSTTSANVPEAQLALQKLERAPVTPLVAPTEKPPRELPGNFTRLPRPTLEPGAEVTVLLDDEKVPGGWATPTGTIVRQFEGTSKWEVELAGGGREVVDEDRLAGLASPDNSDLVPPGREAFDPEKHRPPTFIDDTMPDRLVTADERLEFAEYAKGLKVKPDRIVSLLQQHFSKGATNELTVTELDTLRELLSKESKVPF